MSKIHPKVLFAALGGVTATGVAAVADAFGVKLDPSLTALIVTVCASVAGWAKTGTAPDRGNT